MLEQDGQLGQLGEELLEVAVAPREPIVFSIFRKASIKIIRRVGEEGQEVGRSRKDGGRRVGGGQQARRARRGGATSRHAAGRREARLGWEAPCANLRRQGATGG